MLCRAIGACFIGLTGLLATLPAHADKPVALEYRLAHPVMKEGEAQRNYLRVALSGCEREKSDRTPVNVGFVIDRSGSMQGVRMAQARAAAIAALKRLDAGDIASVVTFDNQIDVLVPAQPVADQSAFTDRIGQLAARGSTAIHAGLLKGADEVRRFKDNRRLNRIVLLSDGLANVGPSRPDDFAKLGRDLLGEGISVSTIGLGLDYNEDLMLALARASDGNHTFVGEATDLIQVFNREFDDVLASCAQTVSIDVELRPGVRAVRALSRQADISGQQAQFRLNQVYQATEHYVLLELELDREVASAGDQILGRVRVAYTSPQDGSAQTLDAAIRGRFSASETEAQKSRDNLVLGSVLEQVTRERSAAAVELRDAGKHEEARALLRQNVTEIDAYAASAPALSERLQHLKKEYGAIANAPAAAAPAQWNAQRKLLRQLDAAPPSAGVRY
jgi:Ca-activated chloride channel family protein